MRWTSHRPKINLQLNLRLHLPNASLPAKQIDENRDGRISFNELAVALRAVDIEVDRQGTRAKLSQQGGFVRTDTSRRSNGYDDRWEDCGVGRCKKAYEVEWQ